MDKLGEESFINSKYAFPHWVYTSIPPNGVQMLHQPVSSYLGENSSSPPLS